MTTHPRARLVSVALVIVTGCGGSSLSAHDGAGGGSGGTTGTGSGGAGSGGVVGVPNDASCSAASAPKPPSASDAGVSSPDAIQAKWLAVLDRLFGQYMRGDVAVYRGSMGGRASTPTSVGYPQAPDGTIAQGPALASLTFRPGMANDWQPIAPAAFAQGNQAILVVHSLADGQYMVFDQPESAPTITATSGIAMSVTQNFLMTTCSGCAPSFWAPRPTAIAFSLAASGIVSWISYGADGTTTVDEPVTSTASALLVLVQPCDLTWDDLATLNQATGPNEFSDDIGLGDFVASAGERVWHASGSVETKQPSGHGMCDGEMFHYSIDLYVSAASFGDYGVRNYTQAPPQPFCAV